MKKIIIHGRSGGAEIVQWLSAIQAVLAFSIILLMVGSLAAFAVFCGAVAGLMFGVASCAKGEITFKEN